MMSLKMTTLLCLISLLMITEALANKWSVKYDQTNICALEGSEVFINATYIHPAGLNVTNKFWLINPIVNKEPTNLRYEPGYTGRMKFLEIGQNQFSLKLSDVKKTDEHVYCFRITTATEKEKYMGFPGVMLHVTDLQLSAPAEVTEGESVVLSCKTTCSLTNPTFIWYKIGSVLNQKTSNSNKICLQSVSSEDAGSYSCAVRGYENIRSPASTLSIRYPPKNTSVFISPSHEIVENSSVTLTCSGDANPPVRNYTWFKDTTPVGNQKTYSISRISSKDNGEYKCKCSNEVGNQYSNNVTLDVLYPPKNVSVSINPSGEIVEGSSVNLTCSSDANPPVSNYTWFKEKESSAVGSGQSYRAVESGQFYCMAQNKHGSESSAAVSVTVNGFQSAAVFAGLGAALFVVISLIVTFFWISRKKKKIGLTAEQSIKQDNLYANVGGQNKTGSDQASDNQDEVQYASVAIWRPADPWNAVKSSSFKDEELHYSSIRFTRPGADYRFSEDQTEIYSRVK